jgi:hypothetical protein
MGKQGGAPQRAQKVAALAAAGVVLLGGATITSLAAWTDTEYVVGGFDGEPGIGTSIFEMQQRTFGQESFADYEDPENPNIVDFEFGLQLSPGATVYGWVQLKTTDDSTVGGEVSLLGATDDESDLWDALTYGARVVADEESCDADGFAAGDPVLTASGSALDANGTGTFLLDAAGGNTVTVCFAVTMVEDASDELQGETVSPVWSFVALSD